MRSATAIVLGLVVGIPLAGCGGAAALPEPPANAQPGPPPGTSVEWSKAGKDTKATGKPSNQF